MQGFQKYSQIMISSKLPHPSLIQIKVGAKGLDWPYIGENWRKLAEIG